MNAQVRVMKSKIGVVIKWLDFLKWVKKNVLLKFLMDFDKWPHSQAPNTWNIAFFLTHHIDLKVSTSVRYFFPEPCFCWKWDGLRIGFLLISSIRRRYIAESRAIRNDLYVVSHKHIFNININISQVFTHTARIDWPPTKCVRASGRKKTELSGKLKYCVYASIMEICC